MMGGEGDNLDARVIGDLWRNVLSTGGWLSDGEGELVCLTFVHEWLFCVMLADVIVIGEHSLWNMHVSGIDQELWDEVLTTYWQWLFRWEMTRCIPPEPLDLQFARGTEEQRPVMVSQWPCLERMGDVAAFERLRNRYIAEGEEVMQLPVGLEQTPPGIPMVERASEAAAFDATSWILASNTDSWTRSALAVGEDSRTRDD